MKCTKKFKKLLKNEKSFILPGTYNALGAKCIERAGFKAVYTSGAGITNSLIGIPDFGLQSFYEIFTQVRYIVNSVNIPVISDIDTGFGNALNTIRTIQEMERIGVAGIQIEDQVFPKRCGHFSGKQIILKEEMVKKIESILENRKDKNFTIIARTDSIATHGIEEAINRGKLYKKVGADIIFVEAPRTVYQIEKIAKEIEGPKLINMIEGALTPQLDFKILSEMGYKIILYPTTTLRASAKAIIEVLEVLKKHGTTAEVIDKLITWEERCDITNLDLYYSLEKKYLSLKNNNFKKSGSSTNE